jgi:hypothetical protein
MLACWTGMSDLVCLQEFYALHANESSLRASCPCNSICLRQVKVAPGRYGIHAGFTVTGWIAGLSNRSDSLKADFLHRLTAECAVVYNRVLVRIFSAKRALFQPTEPTMLSYRMSVVSNSVLANPLS